MGLDKDGKIHCEGTHPLWNDNYSELRGVADIDISRYCFLALKEDGTVVAIGDNEYGCCNTQDWHDISYIYSGEGTSIGVTRDGMFVYSKGNYKGPEIRWENMKKVIDGPNGFIGLTQFGEMVCTENCSYKKLLNDERISKTVIDDMSYQEDGTPAAFLR